MLIGFDFMQVSWEDIPCAPEMAELGAWIECKSMFDRPYGLYNNLSLNSETGELDSEVLT